MTYVREPRYASNYLSLETLYPSENGEIALSMCTHVEASFVIQLQDEDGDNHERKLGIDSEYIDNNKTETR